MEKEKEEKKSDEVITRKEGEFEKQYRGREPRRDDDEEDDKKGE